MRTMRILVIAGCLATLAAGELAGQPKPIQAAPSPAVPHRCYNIQVMIQPYRGSAGAGHAGIMYRIHNLGNGPCTIYGFPGVRLLDGSFSTLPTQLRWGGGTAATRQPRRLVRLGPGGNAYFLLEWEQIPTDGESCPRASYLMITVPNNHLPNVTYAAMHAGSITPCGGRITASPVEPTPFPF